MSLWRRAWACALLLGLMPAAAAASAEGSCVTCHMQFETDAGSPTQMMAHDVHSQRGLSCADCHGGDPASDNPAAAMDLAKGFIGNPTRDQIPLLCARCHADPSYMRKYNPNLPTDQHTKYLTSQHGKKFMAGDPDVPVCTSCHEAHGIRSRKDPDSPVYPTHIPGTCATCHSDASIMDRHGLPVRQHWDYAQSVHGQALLLRGDRAAPHCASCHGSHEAAKPGAIAIGNVCAQCHSLTRDLFAKSPHKAAHDALGLPECEACHGNHLIRKPSDEMLGTGPEALCVGCHEPNSEGYATAQRMRAAIERLKTQLSGAQAVVAQASRLGMDIADAEFELHAADTQLTQVRTYVHSFAAPAMEPIAQAGMNHAQQAAARGQDAIHEFHFRRHGLWLTLGILVLVVGGLLLLIREIERPRSSDKSSGRTPPDA